MMHCSWVTLFSMTGWYTAGRTHKYDLLYLYPFTQGEKAVWLFFMKLTPNASFCFPQTRSLWHTLQNDAARNSLTHAHAHSLLLFITAVCGVHLQHSSAVQVSTSVANPQRDAHVQLIFIAKQRKVLYRARACLITIKQDSEESDAGAKVSGAFVILMFRWAKKRREDCRYE